MLYLLIFFFKLIHLKIKCIDLKKENAFLSANEKTIFTFHKQKFKK